MRAPTGATPEIRAEGLWSALECETPGLHWTVGLEAFAVALDDPFDAWDGERGDRVGLGFDLEWETDGEVVGGSRADDDGEVWYPCAVSGEVLVGAGERLVIDAAGWRSRRWGTHRPPGPWLAGILDDGGWLPPQHLDGDGWEASDVSVVPRRAAPLLDDGVRIRYDLCDVDGRLGHGRAWRCTVTEHRDPV